MVTLPEFVFIFFIGRRTYSTTSITLDPHI